jgi:UDP-2,3-diacylglucosamine pyrophosphatase LpxH
VDLARLLEQHAGAHVIVAGDLFDLVLEAEPSRRARAIAEVLDAHPAVRAGLGGFLDRGGALTLLGGNHDADLAQPATRRALLDALRVAPEARSRLELSPWFWREEGVHVEHGHFYDPDNAPAHPLVVGEPSLGVHFSADFMRATQAHRYLSSNDGTPLEMFLAAFRWYGPRAPYVIYRFFRAAFGALMRSGPLYRAHQERARGVEELARFAQRAGLSADLVEQVLRLGATSTLESFSDTFARLYLDRALSTIVTGAGLGALASGHRGAGGAAALAGSLLLVMSWLHARDRYRGAVVDCLSAAAARIADETDAGLVLFGHTHREALEERYANTGSFAFPRTAPGRPYLSIETGSGRPRATRHYLAA